MTGLFIGLYGIYFLIVGSNGQPRTLWQYLSRDARGYLPWILAIIVLSVLTNFDSTKPMVKPIIALLVLNYFLKNFSVIESQLKAIYNMR